MPSFRARGPSRPTMDGRQRGPFPMTTTLPQTTPKTPPRGRPATGTKAWRVNPKTRRPQWMARLTLEEGVRSPWIALDPTITEVDLSGAARGLEQLVASELEEPS